MESGGGVIKETILREKVRKSVRGEIRFGELMSRHTSFRIGGPADIFLIPQDREDLRNILAFTSKESLPLFVLGEGTNLLVKDKGIRGVVIKLSENFAGIRFTGGKGIAGAGSKLGRVVEASIENGLSGLEFFSGIPGSTGGAVAMNAGTGSQGIGEVIERVKACSLSGEIFSLLNKQLGFAYRRSIFQEKPAVILEVELVLEKGEEKRIRRKEKEILEKRRKSQPLSLANAGCIFKNPENDSAGRLIESAGLKGEKRGGAQISSRHGNFILNRGGARAEEVIELMGLAEETVRKKTGIGLEREIKIVGE